jgi:hypothetical protein
MTGETSIGLPKWQRPVGICLSVLVVLFMLMDATMKLLQAPAVMEATSRIGWSAGSTIPLGLVLLACTALYAWPRTALLGAVLLTAYLGGKVAAHARIGSPLLSHVLFGTYVGGVLWAGLLLREARLRELLPFRRRARE